MARSAVQKSLFFLRWQLYPTVLALPAHVAFVLRGSGKRCGMAARAGLAWKSIVIHLSLECGHNPREALHILEEIIELPVDSPGAVVECGAFLGGSTAKLSLAAKLAGRKLIVCDSFEGLPEVDAKDHMESKPDFVTGAYQGRLDVVSANVSRLGRLECVEFVRGWYGDSLQRLHGTPIACAFWDVDLHDSFRDCIRALWPELTPGAKVFIHDVDREPVLRAFSDRSWWRDEMHDDPPDVVGAHSGLTSLSPLIGYATKH